MRPCGRRCSKHFGAAVGTITHCFLDDDGTLFGYFKTTGTCTMSSQQSRTNPVNERWQALIGPYFATGDAPADQQMRELDEVFHLP
jgi:L-rhamnose mutarotase